MKSVSRNRIATYLVPGSAFSSVLRPPQGDCCSQEHDRPILLKSVLSKLHD